MYSPDWFEIDWCVGCCYSSDEAPITEHVDDRPILRTLAPPFAGLPDLCDEWNR